MYLEDYNEWLKYMYFCYQNKIYPINNNSIEHHNSNNNIIDIEIDNFEEIVYRSSGVDFYKEWLNTFPPLVKRQKAFKINISDISEIPN